MRQRQPRLRDSGYLEWLRRRSCCICGVIPVEAAHIRFTRAGISKRPTGMQEKPDDKWALPLCIPHHREGPDAQHGTNEREWWEAKQIDPLELAQKYYAEYGGDGGSVKTKIFRKPRKSTVKRKWPSKPIPSRPFA